MQSLAFVTQHAKRMLRIVIGGLAGSIVFFHIVSYAARFSRGKKLLNIKYVFLYNFYLQHFSF